MACRSKRGGLNRSTSTRPKQSAQEKAATTSFTASAYWKFESSPLQQRVMRTRVDVSRRILGGKRECLLPGPHDLPRAWPRIALDGRTSWFRGAPANEDGVGERRFPDQV